MKAVPKLLRLTAERKAISRQSSVCAGEAASRKTVWTGGSLSRIEQTTPEGEETGQETTTGTNQGASAAPAATPATVRSGKDRLFLKNANRVGFLSKVSPCAACNETEMQMSVVPRSSQAQGRSRDRHHHHHQYAEYSGLLRAEPHGGVVAWQGSVFQDLSTSEHATTTSSSRLVEAVRVGDTALARVLLKRGAHVDSTDDKGVGALHTAAAYGRDEIAGLLLRMKATHDVGAPPDAMRPLHMAARSGSTKIVAALLDLKADPLIADSLGRTPAWLADRYPEARKILLDAIHSRVRADDDLVYPDPNLGLAAASADLPLVKRLLEERADPNSICAAPALATALQHACSKHQELEAGSRRAAVAWALIEAHATAARTRQVEPHRVLYAVLGHGRQD